MMNPLLVTLTGNAEPELSGKKKRFFRLSKKGKRRATIGAFAVAPVATAAVLGIRALRKRSRKKKAQKKAKQAEARKRQLEEQKRQATATATAAPTPANVQKANTATIRAAAATAASNTAAQEEYQADQEAGTSEAQADIAEDRAEEAVDVQAEERADEATAEETGDIDMMTEQDEQGETMGALTPTLKRTISQSPIAAYVQKNKVPLLVLGAALVVGIAYPFAYPSRKRA